MRLRGGSSVYEGRVEMCINKLWGSICQTGWSTLDYAEGRVVCKQLGYQGTICTIICYTIHVHVICVNIRTYQKYM